MSDTSITISIANLGSATTLTVNDVSGDALSFTASAGVQLQISCQRAQDQSAAQILVTAPGAAAIHEVARPEDQIACLSVLPGSALDLVVAESIWLGVDQAHLLSTRGISIGPIGTSTGGASAGGGGTMSTNAVGCGEGSG
jgi:hypothetical protein